MPAFEQGKIILCDRFNLSTIIYQNIPNLSNNDMDYENNKVASFILSMNGLWEKQPKLIRQIIFNCGGKIAYERLKHRGALNRYDNTSVERLEEINNKYSMVCKECNGNKNFFVDAEQTQEQVTNDIVNYIIQEIEETRSK